MYDVTTGQSSQVAQHDAPIRVVRWIESPQGSVLATGSWDKTIKVCARYNVPPRVRVFILSSATLVLGSPYTKPRFNRTAARTMLHNGCSVSPYGRWDRGATHTGVQPPEPHATLQGPYLFTAAPKRRYEGSAPCRPSSRRSSGKRASFRASRARTASPSVVLKAAWRSSAYFFLLDTLSAYVRVFSATGVRTQIRRGQGRLEQLLFQVPPSRPNTHI